MSQGDDNDTKDKEELQRLGLVVAQKCSSFLSILGSGYILQEVVRSPSKRSKVIFRLLAAMSLSDLLCSIWFFVGTWAVPEGTPGIAAAQGNEMTCRVQAFFMYFAITTLNFNACLALYYLMSIRFRLHEATIRQFVEPICYIYALGLGLAVGIVPIAKELYGPASFWCSVQPTSDATQYIWLLFYVPAWFDLVFVTLAMGAIYVFVRQTEFRSQKYDFGAKGEAAVTVPPQAPFGENNETASSRETPPKDEEADKVAGEGGQKQQQQQIERAPTSMYFHQLASKAKSWRPSLEHTISSLTTRDTRYKQSSKVALQASFYCLAFVITLAFPTCTRAMQAATGSVPYAIKLCFMIFYPAQGFMNFLVYIRPRCLSARQAALLANNNEYPRGCGGIRWCCCIWCCWKLPLNHQRHERQQERHHGSYYPDCSTIHGCVNNDETPDVSNSNPLSHPENPPSANASSSISWKQPVQEDHS